MINVGNVSEWRLIRYAGYSCSSGNWTLENMKNKMVQYHINRRYFSVTHYKLPEFKMTKVLLNLTQVFLFNIADQPQGQTFN